MSNPDFDASKIREIVDSERNFALEKLMIAKNTKKIDEMEEEIRVMKELTSTLKRPELSRLPLEDQVAKYHDEIKPISLDLNDV